MNFLKMMKQAKEMQEKMASIQEEITKISVSGQAGGDLVALTLNGRMEITAISIDRSLMNPAETDVLEDLIIAAHRDARTKIESVLQEKTKAMMAGIELPEDFQLPS